MMWWRLPCPMCFVCSPNPPACGETMMLWPIAQTILITLFWFSSLSIYMYSRLQQTEDPAYNAADDLDNFPFFKVQ